MARDGEGEWLSQFGGVGAGRFVQAVNSRGGDGAGILLRLSRGNHHQQAHGGYSNGYQHFKVRAPEQGFCRRRCVLSDGNFLGLPSGWHGAFPFQAIYYGPV